MVAHRQASFAAGELAPMLHGRYDVPAYSAGAKTLCNFFVAKHGAAVSRPGTRYVGQTEAGARLIPFVVSDTEGYVLEFFDTGLRIIRNGAILTNPFLVSTPYRLADLPGLRTVQIGDILTICHPDHAPRELVRTPGTPASWALSTVSFAVPAYDAAEPMMLKRTTAQDAEDPEHLEREWVWATTMVGRKPSGETFESALRTVTRVCEYNGSNIRQVVGAIPKEVILTRDRPVVIDFNTLGLPPLDYEPVAIRVYRGRGGVFGYVGESDHPNSTTTGTFKDYGDDPDYARPPPSGRNPFQIKDSGGEIIRTENPLAPGLFEQRLVFGGTDERPRRIFASRSNSLLDFDQPSPTTADRSIEFDLAARRREQVRWVLGLDRLLVGTSANVYAIGGDSPLSATDLVTARVQDETGVASIDPLVVEGSILFVRARGSSVREMVYDETRQGYGGADLSILAAHLLDGHEITDWAYAAEPWGLVWAVRDDGTLLSMTYLPQQEVVAWTRHETTGAVEAVCTVPEGDEDAVYLVVKRTIDGEDRRYIERMATRKVADVRAAVCLDSSKTAALAVGPGGTSLMVEGLSHLEGLTVRALVGGNASAEVVVAGGVVEVPAEPGIYAVTVGLPYVCEIETLDTPDDKTRPKIVKRVLWTVEASRGLWTENGRGLWAGEKTGIAVEYRERIVADGDRAMELHTGTVKVSILGGYNDHGRVVLQQRDPLPLTVLAVTREGDAGS